MKLKSYPEYKDSGVEWIGDIPDGWDVQKLKIFSELFGRIGFRGYTVDDLVEEGEGAITLGPPNIEDQKLVFKKKTHISWEKFDESPEIKIYNGDIILVKTASVGKVAFVENLNHPATVNPQLVVFKKIKILSKFFYYCLISPLIQNQILSDMNGGVVSTLSQENIKNYFCTIPSPKQQKKIFTFLDKKTSEIDLTIEKDNQLIELLKEKRTALINHVVTKGLDPTAEMKDSGVEWIGKIPEDWEIEKLKFNSAINKKSLLETCDFDYEFFYLDISNVSNTGKILNTEFMRFENAPSRARRIVNRYDTIISTVRTYLKAIAYLDNIPDNLIVSTGFCVLSPNKNLYPRYLYYLISNDSFIQTVVAYSKGIAYPAINSSDLANLQIWYPDFETQKKLSSFLDQKTLSIDKTIQKIQKNIELLEEYKKSLIHHVVTGKVDIREVAADS